MAEEEEALIHELRSLLGDRARPAEPLARHTSLRVGGPADVLVVPDTVAQLAAIVRLVARFGARLTLLGNGSNLLVGDDGIRGVVVKLGHGFGACHWQSTPEGAVVVAGAAMQLARLARQAVARGLAGLEYAEGIPGTVGGALFMNAGAYGGAIGNTAAGVEGIDGGGNAVDLAAGSVAFDYRRAALPPGFIVTAVSFRLRRDDAVALRARMLDAQTHRQRSQPSGMPSAGSIFKNPDGDYAGRLIEAAGLKGTRVGQARFSERHANFIVNEGGARAADVKALMDLAQRVVWERSGVWLEPEVRLVGNW